MSYVICAVCCVVSFVVGAAFSAAIYKEKPVGVLKIDRSTGEPYMFLDLDVPIEVIMDQKSVTMGVDPTDFPTSRK